MAKPILIARFPIKTADPEKTQKTYKLLKQLAGDDYTILAFRDNSVDRLEFEVLNADKAEQLDITQIEKQVNEILWQNQTSTTTP